MGGSVKKITKPVAKVFDKVVPNEVKPALPYIAAAAPFLAPTAFAAGASGIGSISGLGATASRALLSGGLNLGSQLAQEGSEGKFNPLSVALAAGSGALTSPDAAGQLRDLQVSGVTPAGETIRAGELAAMDLEAANALNLSSPGIAGQAQNFGLEGLARGADVLSAGATPGATLKSKFLGGILPVTTQSGIDAYEAAKIAKEDYDRQLAEYNATAAESISATSDAYTAAIRDAMKRAGYGEDDIIGALSQFNFAEGGRVGYRMGGNVRKLEAMIAQMKARGMSDDQIKQALQQMGLARAQGGIMNLAGREMDMRAGGFIPIGSKEKADDVPARLSKNEFVMTADAVKGAGGGDVNKGAKKMYQTMNKLEAIGRA